MEITLRKCMVSSFHPAVQQLYFPTPVRENVHSEVGLARETLEPGTREHPSRLQHVSPGDFILVPALR